MSIDDNDRLRLFLVACNYPDYEDYVTQGDLLYGRTHPGDLKSRRGEISAFFQDIRTKSGDELNRLVAEARATVRLLTRHEREFNNQFPDCHLDYIAANFDFWSKFPSWRPAEAAALALGADPYQCDYEKLWALADKNPFAEKYCRVFDLVERATSDEILSAKTTPLQFLAWAEDRLDLPQELVAAVHGARAYQKAPSATRDSPPEYLDELGVTRIRIGTVAKLVWGMLKANYEHHPEKERNSTVPRIVSDCLTNGYSIDPKTVRRALSFLADYCEPH